MSYILDALKKSERERTLVRGVGFGDAGRRLSKNANGLLWGLAVLLLSVTVVVAGVLVFRASTLAPASVTASTTATVARDVSEKNADLPLEALAPRPTAVPLVPAVGEATWLAAMPPEFQRALPEMTVNIHVYAPEQTQCILYINNHQYHRGEQVQGGVVVEQIVADGVVLQFRGQRFKLPRPS